jgi:hypothetical protein
MANDNKATAQDNEGSAKDYEIAVQDNESPAKDDEKVLARHRKKRRSNLLRWLGFSVVIGLLPILASGIISTATQKPFSLEETLSHGELLIISIAIVVEALRDLLYANRGTDDDFRSLIIFGCCTVIVLSCLLFGILAAHDAGVSSTIATVVDMKDNSKAVTALKNSENGLNTGFVMYYSFIMFVIALLAGGSCKWTEK